MLEISEPDTNTGSIDPATFGTIVHKAMFNIYQDWIGRVVDSKELSETINNIPFHIAKAFQSEFAGGDSSYGKNYLFTKTAEHLLKNYLQTELAFIRRIKNEGQAIHILGLENI